MTQDFTKIVRLGTAKTYGGRAYSIFCKIKYESGRLSITGVEGPTPSGNALGGCGQIVRHLDAKGINPAPGWTHAKIAAFLATWDKWHLNDMQAGTPAQMAWLAANPQADRDYVKAKQALAEAGLEPDASHLQNGKPYSYGSAWLKVAAPDDALDFLRTVPETDRTPAWV